MARRRRDSDFDRRLDWEIIFDANGPEEQALGWYYYLENHLRFPFRARCRSERPTSPLRIGEAVEVRGMPGEEVCQHEMFVNIAWQERLLAVPQMSASWRRWAANLLPNAEARPTDEAEPGCC